MALAVKQLPFFFFNNTTTVNDQSMWLFFMMQLSYFFRCPTSDHDVQTVLHPKASSELGFSVWKKGFNEALKFRG